MISKEEAEKIKRKLAEELENTIKANQCGLSTNDFSENIKTLETALEYIQQLETKQQKVIEKLERDIKIYSQKGCCRKQVREGIVREAKEILEIMKGEE